MHIKWSLDKRKCPTYLLWTPRPPSRITTGANFQRNMDPCAGCSVRKIRVNLHPFRVCSAHIHSPRNDQCVSISNSGQLPLCIACERRKLPKCEPHVPWRIARERIGLGSAAPRSHSVCCPDLMYRKFLTTSLEESQEGRQYADERSHRRHSPRIRKQAAHYP